MAGRFLRGFRGAQVTTSPANRGVEHAPSFRPCHLCETSLRGEWEQAQQSRRQFRRPSRCAGDEATSGCPPAQPPALPMTNKHPCRPLFRVLFGASLLVCLRLRRRLSPRRSLLAAEAAGGQAQAASVFVAVSAPSGGRRVRRALRHRDRLLQAAPSASSSGSTVRVHAALQLQGDRRSGLARAARRRLETPRLRGDSSFGFLRPCRRRHRTR